MGGNFIGSDFYLAIRGGDEITSSSVAVRTDLLRSNSLTHAESGLVSVGSESVSSFDYQTPSLLVY